MSVDQNIENLTMNITELSKNLRQSLSSLRGAVEDISKHTEAIKRELTDNEVTVASAQTQAASAPQQMPRAQPLQATPAPPQHLPQTSRESTVAVAAPMVAEPAVAVAAPMVAEPAVAVAAPMAKPQSRPTVAIDSEKLSDLKATAGRKFRSARRKVDAFAENVSQNQDDSSTNQALQLKAKILSKKQNVIIIGAIAAAVIIALILFVPFFRWVFLVGAVGWLVFAFIKKANKVMPIAVSVIALALVLFIPSDGVGGGGGTTTAGNMATGGNTVNTSTTVAGNTPTSATTSGRNFSTLEGVEAYFNAKYPNAIQVRVTHIPNVNAFRVLIIRLEGNVNYWAYPDGEYNWTLR